MRTLLTIFLFVGLLKSSFGSCVGDDRTLTEMLFKGQAGTIFTCKILTMTTPKYDSDIIIDRSDGSIDGTSTVEIIQVYFGKVDTNIVTLKTGSFFQIGKTYLIYSSGNGKTFGCGGNCDRWTKQIADNPNSTYEVQLLKQFSDIFKNKMTGKFSFTNSKGVVIADGQYKKGKPVKVWKHYYDNGIIKAEYDMENNVTSQYSTSGFIKGKSIVNKNVGIYEQYSDKVKGQLAYKFIEREYEKEMIMECFEYYVNGNLKNQYSAVYINNKSSSTGKTGDYKEFYENGNLKLQGQYKTNKRVGLWKWYKDNGEFNTMFDYKDGTIGQ